MPKIVRSNSDILLYVKYFRGNEFEQKHFKMYIEAIHDIDEIKLELTIQLKM